MASDSIIHTRIHTKELITYITYFINTSITREELPYVLQFNEESDRYK